MISVLPLSGHGLWHPARRCQGPQETHIEQKLLGKPFRTPSRLSFVNQGHQAYLHGHDSVLQNCSQEVVGIRFPELQFRQWTKQDWCLIPAFCFRYITSPSCPCRAFLENTDTQKKPNPLSEPTLIDRIGLSGLISNHTSEHAGNSLTTLEQRRAERIPCPIAALSGSSGCSEQAGNSDCGPRAQAPLGFLGLGLRAYGNLGNRGRTPGSRGNKSNISNSRRFGRKQHKIGDVDDWPARLWPE